jgi:hypothetical protein
LLHGSTMGHRRGRRHRGIDRIAAARHHAEAACAASGCEVATTRRANTGRRTEP